MSGEVSLAFFGAFRSTTLLTSLLWVARNSKSSRKFPRLVEDSDSSWPWKARPYRRRKQMQSIEALRRIWQSLRTWSDCLDNLVNVLLWIHQIFSHPPSLIMGTTGASNTSFASSFNFWILQQKTLLLLVPDCLVWKDNNTNIMLHPFQCYIPMTQDTDQTNLVWTDENSFLFSVFGNLCIMRLVWSLLQYALWTWSRILASQSKIRVPNPESAGRSVEFTSVWLFFEGDYTLLHSPVSCAGSECFFFYTLFEYLSIVYGQG